ncbi:MAG: Lrp/AsnC family transcriptional regulator [Clostridia bacterium]
MDNIDIKILESLHKNARMNASEIADKVPLSTSAVIERIKKMEASGTIIGYTAILAPEKLNKDIIALISVAIDNPKYNNVFEEAVIKNNHITECFYIAGSFDYLLKVITDNTKSLEGVLHYIKSITGVSKTVTSIVLNICKNEYSVPVTAKKIKTTVSTIKAEF